MNIRKWDHLYIYIYNYYITTTTTNTTTITSSLLRNIVPLMAFMYSLVTSTSSMVVYASQVSTVSVHDALLLVYGEVGVPVCLLVCLPVAMPVHLCF